MAAGFGRVQLQSLSENSQEMIQFNINNNSPRQDLNEIDDLDNLLLDDVSPIQELDTTKSRQQAAGNQELQRGLCHEFHKTKGTSKSDFEEFYTRQGHLNSVEIEDIMKDIEQCVSSQRSSIRLLQNQQIERLETERSKKASSRSKNAK